MTIPAEWMQRARRFGPAAAWIVALLLWRPALGVASLLVLLAGAAIARQPVLGIALAAAAAPFGLWLIEHPGIAPVAICALVSWALVWFHRDEIRRAM